MANKSFDYGTEVSVETPEGIKLGIICYNWREGWAYNTLSRKKLPCEWKRHKIWRVKFQ